MDHRRQGKPGPAPGQCAGLSCDAKKNTTPLLNALEDLCSRIVTEGERNHTRRITEHVLAQLACLGTHTVTGLVSVCGRQFQDWSADYRLYEKARVIPERLFEPVRQWLCQNQEGPIVMALDDTRLRKTGTHVHGVKYVRDPMGPPFHVNFIRAQRFLQTSMAWRGTQGQARMIPVDWVHAPFPTKKPKPHDGEETWKEYRRQSKACCLSTVGVHRIEHLRRWFDEHGARERTLWVAVDGSFTNATVLRGLPARTILVGRIRADAKLFHLPLNQPDKGRHRVYGDPAPTPEHLRQDPSVPWQRIQLFYGGAMRELRVKQLKPLRWRTSGEHHTLQMLVIAPTPYRLRKNSKLLYRKPAYLICTDPDASIEQIVQHFLWRWDIEVNHRDEKTLLGVGDAQVRTPHAVQNVTGCAVAAYAMLLTAAAICQKQQNSFDQLPAPKWQRRKTQRPTTIHLIRNLRYELWNRSIHFSALNVQRQINKKPEKSLFPPESALFYTSRYA